MSSRPLQYPERVHSSGEEGKMHALLERSGAGKLSKGWVLGGLVGIGVVAWMAWHFGPDLARYMKMERM
jgi:hypothetical protein